MSIQITGLSLDQMVNRKY